MLNNIIPFFTLATFIALSLYFVFHTENAIDMQAMKLLTEADIKQLIPKVGLRVKFLDKWRSDVSYQF